MMVYWLHLILLFLLMKALWVEMTAVAPLSYSGEEAILEKQPSVKTDDVVYLQEHGSADSGLYGVPRSSEYADHESKLLDKVKKYNFDIEEGKSSENIDSMGMRTANFVVKRVESSCDKICEKQKQVKLDSNLPGVRAEETSILSSSLENEQVKESKLAQRDISSTYEFDNRNGDSKLLNDNNTHTEEVRFKTVKGIDPSPDIQESVTPLLDVRPSSVFPISINGDQTSAQPTFDVSNNRTVGVLTNANDSSVYNVHIDKGKVVPNYNIDGFTANGEKLSKSSSVNAKLPVKSNKNRTLHEIKTSPQIKYSEESKKKSFVKSLSEESGENTSLHHGGVSHSGEDSSVLLMNDEPKNASGQNTSHSTVFIPSSEDDNLEFPPHEINNITTGGVNTSIFETNETFSTAGHIMKTYEESNFNIAVISGIAVGILVISSVIGAVSFVVYRRRYWNKPHTLSDKCSNADSSGYIDDSTLRDNSEEMYSLDNDSFLNSLEAMTIQNYWTDNVKHTKL